MKRKSLRKMSADRKARVPERRAVVQSVTESQNWVCGGIGVLEDHVCSGPLVGHEPLKRSQGGDYCDPGDVLVVCQGLNGWVEDNPTRAMALGLSRSQGTLYRNGRYLKKYEREALAERGSNATEIA